MWVHCAYSASKVLWERRDLSSRELALLLREWIFFFPVLWISPTLRFLEVVLYILLLSATSSAHKGIWDFLSLDFCSLPTLFSRSQDLLLLIKSRLPLKGDQDPPKGILSCFHCHQEGDDRRRPGVWLNGCWRFGLEDNLVEFTEELGLIGLPVNVALWMILLEQALLRFARRTHQLSRFGKKYYCMPIGWTDVQWSTCGDVPDALK